jgi:hypothetical protein
MVLVVLHVLLLTFAWTEALKSKSLPLFLTFDSGVPIASINGTAVPFVSREKFVWGASPSPARLAAWKQAVPKISISYYMPYSRAPSASKGFGLEFWQATHPDWILYQCDQKTVAFWDGETAPSGSVPLDFTNPDVIKWQVTNQSVYAQSMGYDAMAFDNFGGGSRQGVNSGKACGVILNNGSWAYRFNQSTNAYDPRQQDFFREASVQWIEQASKLMAAVTPKLGIVPNNAIGPSGWGRSSLGIRVMDSSTGILSERGFSGWGSGPIEEQELLDEYEWMSLLESKGKSYYSINETPGPKGENVSDEWAEWVIGAFLVGSQPRSALWLGAIASYGNWSFTHEGLGVPIGTPLQKNFSVLPGRALLRNFTGGIAILNPTTSNCTIDVGEGATAGGFVDLHGKQTASEGVVVLAAKTARVLVFAEHS